MTNRVLVLGGGFGGLEVATLLSEGLAGGVDVTLIDKADSFVFGYSKLDIMFRDAAPDSVQLPYREYVKPGVRVLQETITAIDPEARRVTTDAGTHEADALVIALGADYDLAATPGLAESGDEFYSFAGAVRMRDALRSFSSGPGRRRLRRTVQVPAGAERVRAAAARPSRRARHARACEITLVLPFGRPVPPRRRRPRPCSRRSPSAASAASRAARSPPRPRAPVVVLDDDSELPYDLFLGVPKHARPRSSRERPDRDGYVPSTPRPCRRAFPVCTPSATCDPGDAEGRRLRRGCGAALADLADRRLRGEGPGACTRAPARATSSSAPGASAVSTSTS